MSFLSFVTLGTKLALSASETKFTRPKPIFKEILASSFTELTSNAFSSTSAVSSTSLSSITSLVSLRRAKKPRAAVIIAKIMNNVLGIPGMRPSEKMTRLVGSHAAERFIWDDMCSDIFSAEDTRVTIIAVAIDNNNEGICATKPSPIASKMYD